MSCLFCKIIGKESESEICYEDDELIVFHDIKPASKNHILVVPKQHLDNINALNPQDIPLVQSMLECGKKVLSELNGDLNDVRIGFHRPPFNSIKHLHLHLISPASQMGFMSNFMFKPNTYWFTSVDEVIQGLQSKI